LRAGGIGFDAVSAQLRVWRATGAQVLDRTGVIVETFHRHANTRGGEATGGDDPGLKPP
jgi:hypothetical protein